MGTFLKRFGMVAVFLALVTFALVAYSPHAAAPASEPMRIEVKLFTFKPQLLEVPVGTTVVWTNGDAVEHTVTNGTPEKSGGAFDSDGFTEGKTFSFTFTKPGDYPYFCKRHNFMQGEIKVVPAH